MQNALAGLDNAVVMDMVHKTTGIAITAGTVTFYLRARNGANAGKWFRASDSTWQASESSAGDATFVGGSAWGLSVVAAAWSAGVTYDLYGLESGSLNLVYTDMIVTWSPPTIGAGAVTFTYTLTESGTGDPIPDAQVWVSPDAAGALRIAYDTSDENGQVIFYLDAGTYYLWRAKAGYSFDNPDTEVVS